MKRKRGGRKRKKKRCNTTLLIMIRITKIKNYYYWLVPYPVKSIPPVSTLFTSKLTFAIDNPSVILLDFAVWSLACSISIAGLNVNVPDIVPAIEVPPINLAVAL